MQSVFSAYLQLGFGHIADLQGYDRAGVNELLQFAHPLLVDQHQAHRLDAARGRADATTHTGEKDCHDRQHQRPFAEVFR